MHIVPIVEGHGEVEAVPILIRRLAKELEKIEPEIARPIRCPKDKLIQDNELTRVIKLASLKLQPDGAILILIDADTDCPAELGPQLLNKAKNIRKDISISVILAKCEYEAWFLASLSSLSGKRGIQQSLSSLSFPEKVRGAKERLEEY